MKDKIIEILTHANSAPFFVSEITAEKIIQLYASQPAVSEDEIEKTIVRIEDMHPYKKPGVRESYYEYAEGWSDACDVLGEAIKELLNQKR